MIAIILGNGESRANLDLNLLKKHGKIYGANALYREFTPDVLVAVDTSMIKEIMDSGYHKHHTFYPRKIPVNYNDIPLIPEYRGWSSGTTCANLAILDGAKTLYFIGFDLIGSNGKHNNIYKGTFNYRSADDVPTIHQNWEKQLHTLMIENQEVSFIRIQPTNYTPTLWKSCPNYSERLSFF